jgi:1,4-alpha-glucan branching enzyme
LAASQQHLDARTPLGATLVAGGAAFRVFGPAAHNVFLSGDFNGWRKNDPAALLVKNGNHWGGFFPGIADGAAYKFFVEGDGGPGFKRDPYARELAPGPGHPPNCVVRDPNTYPWHDAGFRPPAFNDLIIYQFHTGTYYGRDDQGKDNRRGRDCTFLDVLDRVEYLAELGVNAIEPLPISEFETETSQGYNGSDLFAPEFRYTMPANDPRLPRFLATLNRLLGQRGKPPVTQAQLARPLNQLKALIDVCHVYGIVVLFDVVYNHAGGFEGDDESIFFWDRQKGGDNNRSLYFTNVPDGSGGLVFAYWNADVRQFLIDNAAYFIREYHVDGFRFDQVTIIDQNGGHQFCRDLTDTLKFLAPSHLLIAEYWADQSSAVRDTKAGGLGFDAVWSAGLRDAVRGAVGQASAGAQARVSLDGVRDALNRPFNFPALWKSVEAVENHDEVLAGRSPRIPRLADGNNPRSWFARSRSRVATGLVLTGPGIPLLFMGQEFLEDKQWSDGDPNLLIFWDGVDKGTDRSMVDFLRFTRDLVALRRHQPALRGEGINVYHVHNDNCVIAFQRWVEGVGRDLVVVASLNESTFHSYDLGFPGPGRWLEVFNSDVYDHWVNPLVAGNGGGVDASGGPMHGLPNSAGIVIPANGLLVFARDRGN